MGFFYFTPMTKTVTKTDNTLCLYVESNLIIDIKHDKPTNTTAISVYYLGTDKFDGSIHTVAQVSTAKYSAEEIETIGLHLVAMAHDMKREATT